jgi:hypothetical protein
MSLLLKPSVNKGNHAMNQLLKGHHPARAMNLLLKTAIQQGRLRNKSGIKKPQSRTRSHAMNLL